MLMTIFSERISPYIASNTVLPGTVRSIRKGRWIAEAKAKAVIFRGWVMEHSSRTPIKDNIAKHRAAHNISDVWLWAGCVRTGA